MVIVLNLCYQSNGCCRCLLRCLIWGWVLMRLRRCRLQRYIRQRCSHPFWSHRGSLENVLPWMACRTVHIHLWRDSQLCEWWRWCCRQRIISGDVERFSEYSSITPFCSSMLSFASYPVFSLVSSTFSFKPFLLSLLLAILFSFKYFWISFDVTYHCNAH